MPTGIAPLSFSLLSDSQDGQNMVNPFYCQHASCRVVPLHTFMHRAIFPFGLYKEKLTILLFHSFFLKHIFSFVVIYSSSLCINNRADSWPELAVEYLARYKDDII